MERVNGQDKPEDWRFGKLQKAILDYLEKKGKPCYSQNISWELFNAKKDEDEFWDRPTRVFDVSLRRAIRVLESKGLVCCGHGEAMSCDDKRKRLMCWLPKHLPPEQLKTVSGREVGKAILAVLAEAKDRQKEIRDYLRDGYNVSKTEKKVTKPGDVPYSWLIRQVAKRIGGIYGAGFHKAWATAAISRAVRWLFSKGMVTGYCVQEYDRDTWQRTRTRVYTIRLNEERKDVAL